MNIVHVIACYYPHAGGMERNTKSNSEQIVARGHRVTVITSDVGYKSGKVSPSENLTVYYLKSFNFAHTPIMPSLLLKLFTISKDSVVHMHVAQAFVPEITFLVCKLRGIPYLAHIHLDVDPTGKLGFFLPFYKKYVLGPILRKADAVTVLTKDYFGLMAEKYLVAEDKIHLIPNGTYFTPGKNVKNKVHKPVRILFLGRLAPQKNIPLLLNSIAICIKKYKIPLRLTLIGEGELKNDVIALIRKLGLQKYVIMVESNDLKINEAYFRKSDIFILSSVSEAFGTVLIEALATGTPVVATDIFSVRNIIKDGYNGLLVKSDPESMSAAIKKLVDNPGLYRKIVANSIKEGSKYRWDKVIDLYEALYRKLAIKTKA